MKSMTVRHCICAIVALTAGFSANAVSGASNQTSTDLASLGVISTYDVAPAPKHRAMPVYPYEQLIQGRAGWAAASFVIDYTGRPLFTNPRASSEPAFAKSVVAMVEASEYSPGKRNKHSVMSPSQEEFQFLEESFDADARRVLAQLRKGEKFPAVSQLDERPHAVRQDSPAYPRALKDDGITGQAEIEFVIDRDGRVLFPRIISASHEDFGWAAATAVAQWKFQPPQLNGQKVEAVMRVPILFDAHKLASAD
ncbi:MAG TPA: TonB family protein [Opitutaceae bacterium]|nr:TonB family protein [Opitutaceae bacterium]